jgi:DUF3025 family protein
MSLPWITIMLKSHFNILTLLLIMPDKDIWKTSVFTQSPIIQQLSGYTDFFKSYLKWPSIEQYTGLFKQQNIHIKPVPQADKIASFEEQYEPRVYLKQELQTRTENWHDFFNALIWLKFSATKKALNQLHFNEATNRTKGSNRTTLENRITQFDECGAIIVSNNKELLELIKNHHWKELFINQKHQFEENIRCVIFGHAIFEKAIKPYIGMTCHCILLEDDTLLEAVKQDNCSLLDTHIADIWLNKYSKTPDKFHALPLLGIPGYHSPQNEDFYSNTEYFR